MQRLTLQLQAVQRNASQPEQQQFVNVKLASRRFESFNEPAHGSLDICSVDG